MNVLDRKQTNWWLIVLALLCLPPLIAFNPFPLYFLNDDFIHIPLSQSGNWGQRNSIRPLGDFTLYIDSLLWGNNAVGYHFTNVVIHLVNSFLVYFFAKRLLLQLGLVQNVKLIAATAAVFFWGYAFHAESIFWIIGRSASLGAFFFLVIFIGLFQQQKSWLLVLALPILFLAGLLAYESVLVIIPIFLLAILTRSFVPGRKNWIVLASFCIMFLYYIFLRWHWTGEVMGVYESNHLKGFSLLTLGLNYFKLIARTLVGPAASSVFFVVSFLVVLVITIATYFAIAIYKKFAGKWWLWITVWFISYLPYLSLGIDTHGVESERYLYLPSIFACTLLVALLAHIRNRKIAVVAFLLCWAYQQYYLFAEAKAFQVASSITRSTIQIVDGNPGRQFYYFTNLPHENFGVPIFRLGLVNGVQWLVQDTTAGTKIRIVSFDTNQEKRYSQKPAIEFSEHESFAATSFYKPATTGSKEYVRVNQQVTVSANDLLINYTDSIITVKR